MCVCVLSFCYKNILPVCFALRNEKKCIYICVVIKQGEKCCSMLKNIFSHTTAVICAVSMEAENIARMYAMLCIPVINHICVVRSSNYNRARAKIASNSRTHASRFEIWPASKTPQLRRDRYRAPLLSQHQTITNRWVEVGAGNASPTLPSLLCVIDQIVLISSHHHIITKQQQRSMFFNPLRQQRRLGLFFGKNTMPIPDR